MHETVLVTAQVCSIVEVLRGTGLGVGLGTGRGTGVGVEAER